ncbi:MAG: LLM class flavin-dependent oxidoreductase [Proteobacteria bacterium]|nr:LLM class flavin-dependent oxidoreductase [Pseudomonadota bacterium]MDA1354805.1 LLM class flavin-dependent oxidoreductase [Pseudomonadota bacterium]
MERLGICFSGGANASEIVECVKLAESLGYESAWVAEGHGGDQFAILAACATATSRILLGTAITSVFVRTAPTIAMAAATVDQLSGGRFILGLGSSHRVQVEPEHGQVYTKPLTRVRETAELVRELLAEGNAHYHGQTVKCENFELWFTPHRKRLPIFFSAVFPKMTELTGELADGIILTRSTLESGATVRAQLITGAARSGKDGATMPIVSLLPTAIGATKTEACDKMRPGFAAYTGYFPRYNRMTADQGFGDEATIIAEAWARGDREGAAAAVSDALIDASGIAGTPEQCRAKIQEVRASGIDVPLIAPFASGPGAQAEMEAVIKACAPAG